VRLEIREESYNTTVAKELVAEVLVAFAQHYGEVDIDPLDPSDFDPPAGVFLVGYVNGQGVACGGLRIIEPGAAEIKRMYVRPEFRGLGFGREILKALETRARAAGYLECRLETGTQQPAATLYETDGYVACEPFGVRLLDGRSRFMAKRLGG
jgi:GNAT superfamily N-acetyltransferase